GALAARERSGLLQVERGRPGSSTLRRRLRRAEHTARRVVRRRGAPQRARTVTGGDEGELGGLSGGAPIVVRAPRRPGPHALDLTLVEAVQGSGREREPIDAVREVEGALAVAYAPAAAVAQVGP